MAGLKKYDMAGNEIGEVAISDDLVKSTANSQMIKDYLVALRANARQWSANTKTRAEVKHTTKKPHPQKGTGRARQGYLGATQYKGGGRVHAPKPKFDMHVRINKKERRAAIRHLLAEKIQSNQLHVLQYKPLDVPKTKTVAHFMEKRSLDGRRVLFVGEGAHAPNASPAEKYEMFVKSLRNIPRLNFMLMSNLSGYDVAVNGDLVIMESALDELMVILGGKS
ncbi:MAG: 50S ribosomal protein L4 [Chlamydiota bacterium]